MIQSNQTYRFIFQVKEILTKRHEEKTREIWNMGLSRISFLRVINGSAALASSGSLLETPTFRPQPRAPEAEPAP